MNFPRTFTPDESPTFSLHVAEISICSKQLSPDSLMRGNLYECKEQVDGKTVFCFVLGLLNESKDNIFFGASRVICTIWTLNEYISPLLLLSKTTMRSKKAIGDTELMKRLEIDEPKFRDMVQASEALFANWLNDSQN